MDEMLKQSGLSPHDVVVEITERVAIVRHDEFQDALRDVQGARLPGGRGRHGRGLRVPAVAGRHRARLPEVRHEPRARHRQEQHQAEPARVAAPARGQDQARASSPRASSARRSCRRCATLGIELGQGFLFHPPGMRRTSRCTSAPMRNAEVIRQWRILKRIEAGRYTTAQDLADEHGVTERTIRRDIEALQEAGFPLYDERTDGRKVWRLVEGYKQRLTQTFTLAELSRALLQQEPDVVPGRGALRPGPRVRLREDPRGAARAQPALPGAHPGPVLRPARSLEGLLARSRTSSRAHRRRRCTSGRRRHRLLLLQQQADQDLHRRPLPPRLLPRRPLPLRAGRRSTARCARSPWSASRRSRCWTQAFEMPADFSVSEYARGAFGIAGGKPEAVEIVFDAGDGRLHPRARLAREPGAGGGPGRLGRACA